MEYKTTYFNLSDNREISVSSYQYYWRNNKQQLFDEIEALEIAINKELESEIIKGKSIDELKKYLPKVDYTCKGNIEKLMNFKHISEQMNEKRFTEQDQALLNEHILKIASEGWKLTVMQPILKGLYDYSSTDGHSYGYGHNVTEGFVMVWEKG